MQPKLKGYQNHFIEQILNGFKVSFLRQLYFFAQLKIFLLPFILRRDRHVLGLHRG